MQVSVIIPTRNRPELLQDALHSVLSQTRPAHEVLIVDDHSDAQHQGKLESLLRLSPTLKSLRMPTSQGVSAARNAGLEASTGEAVLFLDDDDLLHPAMLEETASVLEREPAIDIVNCCYEMFFTPESPDPPWPAALLFNPRLLDRHPLRLVDSSNPAPALENDPFGSFLRYFIPIHSSLLRRRAISDLRFPEHLQQGEDTFFFLSLAERKRQFRQIQKTLVLIRRHGHNTTRSRRQYFEQIPHFYHSLLDSKMVKKRQDRFLIHLKLAYFALQRKDPIGLGHALKVASSPDLLLREVAKFVTQTLRQRQRLMRYYFQD